MSSTESRTLRQLACEIHKFDREPGTHSQFQTNVTQWLTDLFESREHDGRLESERARYAERFFARRPSTEDDTYPCRKRLRSRQEGPPDEGWLWETLKRPRGPRGQMRKRQIIEGWVPPDLSIKGYLDVRLPFPLPDDGLTLAEKYVVLATVHDTELLDGKQLLPPSKCLKPWEQSVCRELKKAAQRMSQDDVERLYLILADLRYDAQQGRAAPVGADNDAPDSPPRRTRRGRKPDTDPKKDKRIFDAWQSGHYKTYADLEDARDLPRGEGKRACDRHRKRSQEGK